MDGEQLYILHYANDGKLGQGYDERLNWKFGCVCSSLENVERVIHGHMHTTTDTLNWDVHNGGMLLFSQAWVRPLVSSSLQCYRVVVQTLDQYVPTDNAARRKDTP